MSLKVDSEILNMQQAIGTPKPSSPPSLSREKKLRRQEIAFWNLLHDVDIESFTELRVGWIGYMTQHSSGVVNRPAAASTRVLMPLSVGYDDNSCRKPRCSSMFFNSPWKYISISPSTSQEIRSSTEWVTEAMLFWLNVIISVWASPLAHLSNPSLLVIFSFLASLAREAVQQSVI